MSGPGLLEQWRRFWKDRPRRRQMIITDITRMEGERVCVGGYLDDGASVRPVTGKAGPDERWLRDAWGQHAVPFSVLDLRVGRAPKRLSAPHTEDRTIAANGHRVVRVLSAAERRTLLERTRSPSVHAIFGAAIHADPSGQWGRYVRTGEGDRSLGTIRVTAIRAVRYAHYPERGRWDYRLRFVDASGEAFQLAVVDLDFRRRLDSMRDRGTPIERIGPAVLTSLRNQAVYLRIGLARGWKRYPDRCYLQITGVYGFDEGERGVEGSG